MNRKTKQSIFRFNTWCFFKDNWRHVNKVVLNRLQMGNNEMVVRFKHQIFGLPIPYLREMKMRKSLFFEKYYCF